MTSVVLVAALLVAAVLSQGRIRLVLAGAVLPALVILTSFSFSFGVGEIIVGLVFAIGTGLAWAQVIPAPLGVQVGAAIGSGIAIGGSAIAARLASEVHPVVGALVFAALLYALEKFGSRSNPFGEWGSLAHTQTNQWWALAVAERGPHVVTLILTLVSGSVGFAIATSSLGPLILAVVVVAITAVVTLLWSGSATGVPLATGLVGLIEPDGQLFADLIGQFVSGKPDDAYWDALDDRSEQSLQQLLDRTIEESRAGAEIVVWAEGAGVVSADGYENALAAAQNTVRQAPCVLVASWIVLDRSDNLMSNIATTITPDGAVAATTGKRHPVPGAEADRTRSDDGTFAAVDTALGRLGVAICFDADHNDTWERLAANGVEIVAIPASDWPLIGTVHADMARLRSRSIGAAMIRPARAGVSMLTDSNGRMMGRIDHRHSNEPPLRRSRS